MPAAEPGNVQRPRRVPLRRRQAHLHQADQHLRAGFAGSRALHLVRSLHPVLRADRRRSFHRHAGARRPTAGRHLRQRTVRLLFLGQLRADLPGGRADRDRLPFPGPSVRPGLQPERVRALRIGVRAAHRPPPRQGAAQAGRRRPRSQRRVELRQGPVGVQLRDPTGPDHYSPDPRRRRLAATGVLVPRDRHRGPGTRGSPRPHGCAGRRPGDLGGRLCVLEVRSNHVGHQRHRFPRASAFAGGGRIPGCPHRGPAADGQLFRPGNGTGGGAGRLRTRRRVAHRVLAVAQGGPQARRPGVRDRPVRHPCAAEDVRSADPDRSRRRGFDTGRAGHRRGR